MEKHTHFGNNAINFTIQYNSPTEVIMILKELNDDSADKETKEIVKV